MTRKQKWYVGLEDYRKRTVYRAFQVFEEPTQGSHGHLYNAVIGPFASKKAALWAVKHGKNNPHFQNVSSAERLCRI